MSKIRKFLFAMIPFSALSLYADQANLVSSENENKLVTHSMGYMQLGLGPAPFPLPVFGVGFRAQKDHNGIDASLQISTIVFLTQVKASTLYHYYFTPSLKSQFYAGGGIGLSGIFYEKYGDCWRNKGMLSPEFVFGKQYLNDTGSTRFFQAQMSFPTFFLGHFHKPMYFPLVVISYGIGF